MSANNNGGPAFPRAGNEVEFSQSGMTLRDYFAGQALMGALASYTGEHFPPPSTAARLSYEYADAMLKERERVTREDA